MFMDSIGYILSEVPVFIFMLWSAVRWVRFRRSCRNQPFFSDKDRRLLFQAAEYGPSSIQFYPRFALAVAGVATAGILEIIVLAPLGGAIVAGAILLTSAAIVRSSLMSDS